MAEGIQSIAEVDEHLVFSISIILETLLNETFLFKKKKGKERKK